MVGTQHIFPSTARFTGFVDLVFFFFSSLDFSLINKHFASICYASGLVHQGPNRPKMWFISSVAALCWSQGRNKLSQNNGVGCGGHHRKPEEEHRRLLGVRVRREVGEGVPEEATLHKSLEGCWSWEKGVLGKEERTKADTREDSGCHGFSRREGELGSDRVAERLGGPDQEER